MRIPRTRLIRAASSNKDQIGKGFIAAYAASLVLTIVAESDRPGYAVFMRVNALSSGNRRWTDGMLYLVLHRPEKLATSLDGGECRSNFQVRIKRFRRSRQSDPRFWRCVRYQKALPTPRRASP